MKDKEYLNLIKITIYQTKSEYQSDSAVNPALLWDMIKMKVRKKSISYATAKNHKTKFHEDILFKEISRLEKELNENTGLSDTQKSLLHSSLDNIKNRSAMRTWGLMLSFIPFGWNAVVKYQYLGLELLQVRR